MGLFNWLFGRGDEVVDNEGQHGKVKGFKPEGFVEVKKQDGKVVSKFGGNLTKVDKADGK